MILELLKTIRTLKSQKALFDCYEHAYRVMGVISQRTNRDYVIVAALLHKVKELLSDSKWDECKEIMCKRHPDKTQALQFTRDVERIVDQMTKVAPTQDVYAFSRNLLAEADKDVELIFLCSILCEVQMIDDYAICLRYEKLINKLVEAGSLDYSDSLVQEIQAAVDKLPV